MSPRAPSRAGPRVHEGVTLFVTRERGEHRNVYHSMTDFLNAFIALGMLHINVKDVQVGFGNVCARVCGVFFLCWRRLAC